MAINYSEKIPNNVDLADDRTLQRALEHWQPKFLDWWHEMGPTRLRGRATSTCAPPSASTRRAGRATATVKMPDYRWGIFLADAGAGPHDRLRRPHGRAGVAAGARRIPLARCAA